MEKTSLVRSDFDYLARLANDEWDHNQYYHTFLLKHLPAHSVNTLDIGTGTGAFARKLARRSDHVLALDLSSEMIEAAKTRSSSYRNIQYQVQDVTLWDFPPHYFDGIASIATLHHLQLEVILPKIKQALKPGGVFVVLDLFEAEGLHDLLAGIIASPIGYALKFAHDGKFRSEQAIRDAWKAHGQHDTYLKIAEIRRICAAYLPGAAIKQHLLWRYSLIWKNSAL